MQFGFLIRLFLCIFIFGLYLYAYVEKQNQLTELRLEIPQLSKEVRRLKEENAKLLFDVDRFENPANLMKFMTKPEFSHLKHPLIENIIIIPSEESVP